MQCCVIQVKCRGKVYVYQLFLFYFQATGLIIAGLGIAAVGFAG